MRTLNLSLLGTLGAGLLSAAACVTDTAANYVLNFGGGTGCTITSGSTTLSFSNFAFIPNASGPTTGGAATQFNFIPLIDVHGVGFDFVPTSPFTASATGVNDIQINFVATVVGGANVINGLYLAMTGSAGAGVGGGPGTDILAEQFCRGGSQPPGSCPAGQGGPLTDTLTITGPQSGVTVQDTKTFTATNGLSILKDMQLNGNNGSSPSTITDLRNQVQIPQVPEPTTAFLLGSGLVALGLVRSRSRKSR